MPLEKETRWAFVLEVSGVRQSVCQKPFTFSTSSACITTNVPLGILKKCCIFLEWFETQDRNIGLWLVETFSTSSETLHAKPPELPEMFLCMFRRGVVTFRNYFMQFDQSRIFQWSFSIVRDIVVPTHNSTQHT